MGTHTEAHRLIAEHRRVWERKPELRRIYQEEFFSRLLLFCQKGQISIEIGAGPGFLKEMLPDLIATDVVQCPWLDAVVDAQRLPFKNASVTNLLGVDVLHHFETPVAFLTEAKRVLAPRGRLILVEPWVSPLSYFIYRYFHQEDCDMSASPLEGGAIRSAGEKKAFDGNQAIPYLLFGPRGLAKTLQTVPGFKPLVIEPFCLFAYLLSLGFKRFSLLPEALYDMIAWFERSTIRFWRPTAALRVFLVLERQSA